MQGFKLNAKVKQKRKEFFMLLWPFRMVLSGMEKDSVLQPGFPEKWYSIPV